jgi:threonine aldolase
MLAAAALYALDHHRDELTLDIENSTQLAEALSRVDGVSVDLTSVQSNIVRFDVAMDAGAFATECHARGVYMLPTGGNGMRAVLHRDVDSAGVLRAVEIMASVVEDAPVG